MSRKLEKHIQALECMKKYPKQLYYKGNTSLLERPKIAIVGSRRPSHYTKTYTYELAKQLALRGVCIISGAAMGVDAMAHEGAGSHNTIAVVANGLDIYYPAVNKTLLHTIEKEGLLLSQFKEGFRATGWSFVVRNELVVALGDILIVTEANLDSGSMRSVEYALAMGKEIYVLPHHLNESLGTNLLLKEKKAKVIIEIEDFVSRFGKSVSPRIQKDDFFYFCQKFPTLDETVEKFGDRVYEAELEGIITIQQGIVKFT